jgi:SAM-dependent methyltransferase
MVVALYLRREAILPTKNGTKPNFLSYNYSTREEVKMHTSAMKNGRRFFDCYGSGFNSSESQVIVVEIGSQDVNGSLRDVCPPHFKYIGIDFVRAKNVDIVLQDPYKLPFENDSIDIIVSSSCFEHSEFFWLVYLEILRVLKPKGLLYMNVPSRGRYHQYPVDCWRFYPDSGFALSKWGLRNGFDNILLESYTEKYGDWGDFVSVFLKDKRYANDFPSRIVESHRQFFNGRTGADESVIINKDRSNNGNLRFPIRFIPKILRPLFGYPK